ncbi:MAG: RNA polymerase sigma factor RpoE [Acidiferrobacterales bacterium]|nr:RNA polymerase sigma factor RpoE [Acidiferrobacterales bacterium]
MDTEVTDKVLVERVRSGDKQAFNLLVAKYQFKIQNLVSRFIKDRAEQEDVTQEAFIKAYRAIGNFRGESAFYTWLYRIAVNTAKNQLVGAGRRPPQQDVDIDESGAMGFADGLTEMNSPDAILQNDELVQTIRQAIGELPDELRQAITLREFDGLSYEEIADVMECPIGTVRSRIFRAREAIEQAMEIPLK